MNQYHELILKFLKQNHLCVISTVNRIGHPQSAVMEYAETNNMELLISTFRKYRKYPNLVERKFVAAVIGWDEGVTVQYEGEAHELRDEELKKMKSVYLTKLPEAKKWEGMEGISYFRVKPTWIRYTNMKAHPWQVIEIKP